MLLVKLAKGGGHTGLRVFTALSMASLLVL
jgi:hypothetical protein